MAFQSSYSAVMVTTKDGDIHQGYERKTRDSHQSGNLVMRELIAQEKADWIYDFTDVFDVEDHIYIDACHVNALGNEIVAERIDRLIGDRLTQSSQ